MTNTAPILLSGTGRFEIDPGAFGGNTFQQNVFNISGMELTASGEIVIAFSLNTVGGLQLTKLSADGYLDFGFGFGGLVTLADYLGSSALTVTDDAIYAVGANEAESFAAVIGHGASKFDLNGRLDTSFGGDGIADFDVLVFYQTVTSLHVAGGALQVVGHGLGGFDDGRFVSVALDADGNIDASYGLSGTGTVKIDGLPSYATDSARLSDGSLLLAGDRYSGIFPSLALAKLTPSGVLDTNFGEIDPITNDRIGTVSLNILEYTHTEQIDQTTGGAFVVSGHAVDSSQPRQGFIAKFTAAGDQDASFGTNGVVMWNVPDMSGPNAQGVFGIEQVIADDGDIVVAGIFDRGDGDRGIVLRRFEADGSDDTGFGTSGSVEVPIPTYALANSVQLSLQSDGSILVAVEAFADAPGYAEMYVYRFDGSGARDGEFAAPTFVEAGDAVVIDRHISIRDAELDVQGYAGSSVILERSGGANTDDVFGASGLLGPLVEGGDLVYSGQTYGTVDQNSAGRLILTITANTFPDDLSNILRLVTYANTSSTPPPFVNLSWTFSDGNTGAQGSGGAAAVMGQATIAILPADVAPTAIEFSATSFAENNEIGATVATLTATDPDDPAGGFAGPFTFELVAGTGSDDNGLFSISGNELRFNAVANFEADAQYAVRVRVTDNGGKTFETARLFTITDVNDAPTAVVLSNTMPSLVENTSTSSRIKVGDIAVTDDANTAGNALGLTGTDAAFFEIIDSELFLKAGTVLNFEAKSSYAVAVTVDDAAVGATPDATSGTYTLALTNINEAPSNVTLSKASVQEFRASGTVVATLSATDADAADSFTYALTNNAGGRFAIVGNELRVAKGLLLDREQAASHAIQVRVTDSGGLTFTKNLTIGVTDVNPENIIGNASANTLYGGSRADKFDGAGGNDKLFGQAGNDTLLGGSGNDTLTGGAGRDIMTGGSGADDFDYNSITETGKTSSSRDIIMDFTHGSDDIDLSTIDANGTASGNAAFKFLAAKGAAFTGVKGQLKWSQINSSNNALDKTIIEGDINGDRRADFQIELKGIKTLTSSDFIL